MSKKESFDKLYSIHCAIEEIDRIPESKNCGPTKDDSKIDLVLNIIKDIDKRELDDTIVNKVVSDIREGLLIMYINELNKLNKDLNINESEQPVYRYDY